MDRKYIDDNEIAIKYLRNQLTPEEVEQFEVYLMDDPEMLERLELDQLLTESKIPDTKLRERDVSLIRWFTPAASLAIGFMIAVAILPRSSEKTSDSSVYGTASQIQYLRRVDVNSLRSGEQNQPIPVYSISEAGNRSKQYFVAVLETGLPHQVFSGFQIVGGDEFVELTFSGNSAQQLNADENGDIVLVVPVSSFNVGKYAIELLSSRNSEQPSLFFPMEVGSGKQGRL